MNSPRTKRAATAASAGLSLLWIAVYGSCNWITSQRNDVGTWYYQWERFIPFVPWMIVPYMSIDLFFVAAPFLCQSREELRTFARRTSFAIVVAGACFLLVPLRFGFPRPQPAGAAGAIYSFLHGFDQPYNLFPSFHIALRTILAELYARHTKGPVRTGSRVWFSLIGFSTLLTYQHHFVDVIGGFILAGFCFYLFREDSPRLPVIPNFRVGGYYAAGASACLGAAFASWPGSGILLWPALSLSLAAAAYCGVGPSIYRKAGGRLALSARILLAPNLLGQRLSLVYYRRRCAAWNQVTSCVWIGSRLTDRQAREATLQGVTAVLDLTAEFSETPFFLEQRYCNLPLLDLTAPISSQLRQAAEFIAQQASERIVYVHCKAGYSRSAAAVAAYLLTSGQAATIDQALAILRQARPSIVVRREILVALENFASQERTLLSAPLLGYAPRGSAAPAPRADI